MPVTQTFQIKSSDRDSTLYPNTNEFVIDLGTKMRITKSSVIDVCIQRHQRLIEDWNAEITIITDSQTLRRKIPRGDYSIDTLLEALRQTFPEIGFEFDTELNRVKITCDTSTTLFLENCCLATILGYKGTDRLLSNGSNVLWSSAKPFTQIFDSVELRIQEFDLATSSTATSAIIKFDPDGVGYIKRPVVLNHHNTVAQKIHISLLNTFVKHPYEMHGAEFCFTLEIE